jgi:hypothetical protein
VVLRGFWNWFCRTVPRRLHAVAAGLLLIGWLGVAPAQQQRTAGEVAWRHVSNEGFCVTNGSFGAAPRGRIAIDTPSSRAFARGAGGAAAEIRFRYLGPSAESKPLASGELRRQIGLKLHAQDTCNLVYAMWHIEPDARIAVSVKRNPGMHTHEACGAHGYTNIRPAHAVEPARIAPGEDHVLRAVLSGDTLVLSADGRVVWEGTLGGLASGIDGPVGVRTDNARFEFEYFIPEGGPVAPMPDRCIKGPGD